MVAFSGESRYALFRKMHYLRAQTTSARRSKAVAKRRKATSNIDPISKPSVRLLNS